MVEQGLAHLCALVHHRDQACDFADRHLQALLLRLLLRFLVGQRGELAAILRDLAEEILFAHRGLLGAGAGRRDEMRGGIVVVLQAPP